MRDLEANYIRPIVEYYGLEQVQSRGGVKYEIMKSMDENDNESKYKSGIIDDLKKSKGIYIFYDSRGRALYAGKAVRQSLWNEIKNAYNRNRGDVQTIKIVDHPINNIEYRPYGEKRRKIINRKVQLFDLASYVSVYEVRSANMIPMLEALIIRAFANDLLNKKWKNSIILNNNL